MLPIITIPHPTLRSVAESVTKVDLKLKRFISQLEETLDKKRDPKGVGLAAPQVDKRMRVFCTNVTGLQHFINPHITSHSQQHTLGEDPKEPYLEGCLSMPGLYAPVPRWEWVELEYQLLQADGRLAKTSRRFALFHARVIQHELDHLNGVLFTDHALKHGYVIYQENSKTHKLDEIEDYEYLERL